MVYCHKALDRVLTFPQLDLLLPMELQDDFFSKLNGRGTLQYAKVYIKLSEIVEGDFFNDYIKTGISPSISDPKHQRC